MSKLGHNQIFTPQYSGPSQDEVSAANIIIQNHKLSLENQKKGTLVKCQFCGHINSIKDLDFILTHHYVRQHAASADYWIASEGYYICPNPDCKHKINRIFPESNLYQLQSYFKSIKKEHNN